MVRMKRGRLGGGDVGAVAVGGEELVDEREEDLGEEGFGAEDDVKAGIFLFGFFEAADDEDGEVRVEGAEASDELSAVHAGHEVVGEDETDFGGEICGGKLLERTGWAEGDIDVETIALQDGLPDPGLDCVIVDKKNCARHAAPATESGEMVRFTSRRSTDEQDSCLDASDGERCCLCVRGGG